MNEKKPLHCLHCSRHIILNYNMGFLSVICLFQFVLSFKNTLQTKIFDTFRGLGIQEYRNTD